MIQTLQKRFVMIAMGCFTAALCLVLVAVNCAYAHSVHAKLDERLVYLAQNGGVNPSSGTGNFNQEGMNNFSWSADPQQPADSFRELMELRYFIIGSDQSEQAQEYNLRFISSVSSSDARSYLDRVLTSGKAFGYCEDFRYYVTTGDDGSYTAVFLYCHDDLSAQRSLFFVSLGVMLFSLALILLLVILLSRRATAPIARGIERQQQFITDASHELKTPLGVLAANNDVMAMEYGDNEWIESSRRQIKRLDGLTKNLVLLSRLDENLTLNELTDFCAGQCVLDVLQDFAPSARQRHLTLEQDIERELSLRGDADAFRHLTCIFMDNAVKYTPENGWVRLGLHRRRAGAVLTVENCVDTLPAQPLDRLFDRFYRGSSSRSGQSGYGIGLSLAKTLADTLGWSLSVHSSDEKSICFILEI